MRREIIAFLLVISLIGHVKAQEYKTSLGLRAGSSWGLSVKHFESSKAALEGLLTFRWEGFGATGLYEVHNKAFEVDHLYWYYGEEHISDSTMEIMYHGGPTVPHIL